MTKSNPVFKENGEIDYIVSSDIFLDRLDAFLRQVMRRKNGTALLIGAKGEVVSASNRIFTKNTADLNLFNAFDHPDCIIRCVVRDAQDQLGNFEQIKKPTSFESKSEVGNVFAAARALAVTGENKIYVFTMVPESNYSSYLKETIKTILIVGSIILIFLIGLGYFISLYVSAPILMLNEKVKKIGEGKWSEDLRLSRKDEIGELAQSFNLMAKRLRKTLLNLESLVDERAEDLKDIILKYSKSIEDLEHANATKDRFFSIIAHDLKSPFNALKGYSAVIEDSFDSLTPEQLRDMVNKIAVSSEEAHGLLENLLQWAMVQKGGLNVKWQVLNARELVSEVFELMKVNAKVKNIDLINEVDSSIWMYADQNMSATVIRNIVSNSIKFTPSEGQIKVVGRLAGKRVIMEISDTGIGISKENIAKIFAKDVFYTSVGTSDEKGTGLGIGLSKEFVLMNEGTIEVDSTIGVGTTFIVSWKAAEGKSQEIKKDNSRVKILLVDDSEDNHNLLNIYLKGQGWEIINSMSGKEAISEFEKQAFDIVLLDLNMPEMDGYETCTALRGIEKEKSYKPSHIICFTSSILQSDIDKAVEIGFDSFIVKPAKKQKLINTINRLIG